MGTLCDNLLKLITQKFDQRRNIKDVEWNLIRYYNNNVLEKASENSTLVKLDQEIQQQKTEIEDLEVQINQVAYQILNSPLCLLSIPNVSKPYLRRLARARTILEEMEEGQSEFERGGVDTAWMEVQRALELLKLDRALAWLFQAVVLARQHHYEEARQSVEQSFEYFSEQDQTRRMVARLIQGNIYSASSTGRIFEGQNAYSDALWRLEKLSIQEAERGNQLKAELYRVLKEQLQQKLAKPREWKTTKS